VLPRNGFGARTCLNARARDVTLGHVGSAAVCARRGRPASSGPCGGNAALPGSCVWRLWVPGRATRCLSTGHTALPTRRHWPSPPARRRPLPLYSGHAATHTATAINLVPKQPPSRASVAYKTAPLRPHTRDPEPLPPRHWHPTRWAHYSAQPVAAQALLTLLLAPLEPTHAFAALAELPARRSSSSHGRRRAAVGELHPPLDPRPLLPSQHLL
jgi:hypothetical protein